MGFDGHSTQKKRALVLFGSPHKNGHTKKALDTVIEELSNEYEFDLVDAYRENIAPCKGCSACAKTGQCIGRDFDQIDSALRNAELVIIATPVYNFSFPAPLKAILDRFQLYYSMKKHLNMSPFIDEKKAILLVTCGSRDPACKEAILQQSRLYFKLLNAKLCRVEFVFGTDTTAFYRHRQK